MTSGGDFHRLRVKRLIRETADAVSLVFEIPEELSEVFEYRAGQFVTLDPPLSSEPLFRCYSMSSAPGVDSDLRITVKRTPDGRVSNWLTGAVSEGSILAVSRPGGRFLLSEGSDPVVLYAAGSGITPIFALIKSLLATTERQASLMYANRDEESIIFRSELAALKRRHGDRLTLLHHLDAARGLVTADQARAFAETANGAEYYVCGPAPFMEVVEKGLNDAGVLEERIHIERFTLDESNVGLAAVDIPEHVQISAEVNGRRKTFDYRPGLSLLHAVRAAGLGPPSSCELGTCGTCIAHLVEGNGVMRHNIVLSDEEVAAGWVLTCQALPTSSVIRLIYE